MERRPIERAAAQGSKRFWHVARLALVLSIGAAIVSSCSDVPVSPIAASKEFGVSAKIVPNEDPGAPQDPNISLVDTYGVAIAETQEHSVTYTTSASLNPATLTVGNVIDASTPVTRYRYEVGYNAAGQQVAAQRLTPSDTADHVSPGDAVNFAFVGNTTIETDVNGQVVPVDVSAESQLTSQFRAGIGDINAAPPLINGFSQAVSASYLTATSPTARALLSPAELASANPAIVTAPSGVVVNELSAGVIETIERASVPGATREKRSQYRLVGRSWELKALHAIETFDVNGQRGMRELSTTIMAFRSHRNAQRDALRAHLASLTATSDVLTRGANAFVLTAANLPTPNKVVPPDTIPIIPPPSGPPCEFSATRNMTGPRVALQHGILSDCGTWRGYGPDLWTRGTNLTALRVTTTPSDQSYADQAFGLTSATQATQMGPWVVVGHSNGGIVARKALSLNSPSIINGIITLNTPHAGAPITQWNRELAFVAGFSVTANAAFITISTVIGSPVLGELGGALASAVGPAQLFGPAGLGTVLLQGSQPVFREMQPGPNAAGGLNQPGAEANGAGVKRFGLYSETSRDWLSVRLACDFLNKDSNACVKRMKRASRFAFITAIVGTIAGFAGFTPGFAVAAFAGSWLAQMKALDVLYKWMVDGNTSSDGVVPSSSQRAMPNAISVTQVPGDPDHVIAPSSPEAHFEVEKLLRSQFGANILPIP